MENKYFVQIIISIFLFIISIGIINSVNKSLILNHEIKLKETKNDSLKLVKSIKEKEIELSNLNFLYNHENKR